MTVKLSSLVFAGAILLTQNSFGNVSGRVSNECAQAEYLVGNFKSASGSYSPGYLKDGQLHWLSENGSEGVASSIFVDGEDVYIGGSLNKMAGFWKNDIWTPVESLAYEYPTSSVKSLIVAQGKVYTAITGGGTYVDYNGNTETYTRAIAASDGVNVSNIGNVSTMVDTFRDGDDIYFLGNYMAGQSIAFLIKNGVLTSLYDQDFRECEANALFVLDKNVHVVGSCKIDGMWTASIWEDRKWRKLPVQNDTNELESSRATSIFVTKNEVIIGGHIGNKGGVWINDTWKAYQAVENAYSQVNFVAHTGKELYVAGQMFSSTLRGGFFPFVYSGYQPRPLELPVTNGMINGGFLCDYR